jgi:hypothetical protein
MSLPPLTRAVPLALVALACVVGTASGALVEVNDLVLHADGGFTPQLLPRHRFAPIEFQGYVELSAKGGGKPTALKRALIEFDRDGHLDVAGLPTCQPEAIAAASTAEARRACRGAIVGTGEIEAAVSLPSGEVPVRSPLTIFNGPRLHGSPTAVLHARTTVPVTQTYAIVVPIERRPGAYRYRVRLEMPAIAGGLGALTRLEVHIARRFRAKGRPRSYVSARCSDHILRTRGHFLFEDGTVIAGAVERYCAIK